MRLLRTHTRSALSIFTILLLLGVIDAWAGRRSYVAADTVSYMDMASAIAKGNLGEAVNGLWSPLYPVILAVFTRPFQANAVLEFSAVRAANFLVFLLTVWLFHVFLNRFRDQYFRAFPATPDSCPPLSPAQFTVVAYAVFVWGCFSLNSVSRVSPDASVAAMVFAAAALMLSFIDGRVSRSRFVAFGAVLGIGYLVKAIFAPMSILFLASAVLEPRIRAVWKRLLLVVLTFVVIAAPLVAALSMKYGHPTFGEVGKFNYWWFVNEVKSEDQGTLWVHWQGDPPGSGVPVHPTRRVLKDPDVFEFGSPIVATYAPWYDPSYWNEGAAVQVDVRRQAANLARNVRTLARTLLADHFFLLTVPAVMILLVTGRNGRFAVESVVYFKSLWIVGVGIVGLYLLLVLQTRYVAAVFPLLVMLLVSTLRVRTPESARVVGALLVALSVLGVALQCGPRLARAAATIVSSNGDVRDDRWIVAEEFRRVGVKPETPVAAIDQQEDESVWPQAILCDWARLARVRVVGEVRNTRDEQSQFWRLSSNRQNEALQALRRAGARIAVATGVPAWADTTGWARIRRTDYYYRFLD